MSSSPPNKLFEGQTGFPTPNAPPDDTGCRVFVIPSDEEWFALFMAATLQLTYEYNWFSNGDMTPAEASSAWSDIIDAAYERALLGTCDTDVPAPYWDESSGDDADDEAPVTDQPWYGEIVAEGTTWREQVGIWAISAFVAVAATPAAAIAFLPFANRFVLAFKQHSLGAIVKVLIDGVEMVTADTYAPTDGILNVPISLPAPALGFRALDADPPVLWVMMTDEVNPAVIGTPNMQVIRKRLDVAEITPSNLRWNSDCDCVQQSPDGGSTWVDSPTQDPRSSTIFQLPARTGGDPRCDAATQMRDRVKHMLDAIIASSDILQAINSVVTVIAVFFLDFGIVIEAIWAIVSAVFSIGTTTLSAALTDDVYNTLLCIFYCRIGGDGTCTQAQYDQIVSDINAQLGTIAALAITQMLASIGFVGLTNAGALGEVTGDCSACDCGWCFTDDLTVDDGGLTLISGGFVSTWADGIGWESGCFVSGGAPTWEILAIEKVFGTAVHLTTVDLTCDVVGGTDIADTPQQIQGLLSGVVQFTAATGGDTGMGLHFSWVGDAMVDQVQLIFYSSRTDCTGSTTATNVLWAGRDTNPFPESNC